MKILVTGPHRSGTTFVAMALANDLNLPFMPEETIGIGVGAGVRSSEANRRAMELGPCVLQCPFLAPTCHALKFDLVVWVRRDPTELRRSRQKAAALMEAPIRAMMRAYNAESGDLLDIQERNWTYQRERCVSWEVDYESFSGHPLFVKDRQHFSLRQVA